MHRRGGGKFRGNNRQNQQGGGSRFSDEHDSRMSGGNQHDNRMGGNHHNNFIHNKTNRRVSFKTSGRLNKSIDDMKIRAYLENDDEMGSELQGTSDGMRRPKGRFIRKGSPIPRGMGGGKLMTNPMGWYQVTIQHGAKYDKNTLLNLIMNAISPMNLIVYYFKSDNDTKSVQFYLEDYDVAEKVLQQDKKISLPDGFKMMIRVRGSVPQVRIDATLKERMKLAMAKRYNAQTKAMDLTKFHTDPDLRDVFCALSRPPIITAVIEIIAENIPDLEALSLNENRLGSIDHLKIIPNKLPNLKILYLGDNRIFTISSLDIFKPLPLVELYIAGNQCRTRFKDTPSFVREIKKKFPNLMKLDGVEIGPSIGFDIAEDEKKNLPPWKQAFFCNSAGQELAAKFLQQYFAIYDSDDRQQLLAAYHDNAMFSITATSNQHYTSEERLSSYWKVGRNLKHPKGVDLRMVALKRGKLSIVALLNDLPPSKHDLNSFAVDLTFFTPQMIVLTVTGLFKERNTDPKAEYARIFQKTLVIVSNNAGFCIKNEVLHINNASVAQARNAFKIAPPVSTITSPMAGPSVQSPAGGASDDSTKLTMIQAMSQQSNMNMEWSKKCLEESNWDFNRASFAFQELFKQNKIPPEAFAK